MLAMQSAQRRERCLRVIGLAGKEGDAVDAGHG